VCNNVHRQITGIGLEQYWSNIKCPSNNGQSSWKNAWKKAGACSGLDENISYYNGFDIMVGDTRLIVVPCGIGGAYNFPYALYVGYDVIVERLSFPDIREDKPSTVSTAYNIDFDPKTKIFTSFMRGRGIGDCGLWYKWKLADAGAPALVLLEVRRKDDCDENDMGGPQNFPLIWPVSK